MKHRSSGEHDSGLAAYKICIELDVSTLYSQKLTVIIFTEPD
jgi:hypothetical protein